MGGDEARESQGQILLSIGKRRAAAIEFWTGNV